MRNKQKFLCSAFLSILCGALAPAQVAMAADKINSVSIRLEVDEVDEFGEPVVEAETSSSHYSVSDILPASDYYSSESRNTYEGQDDVYVVEVEADDDYYFRSTRASAISIRGLGAEFIKATKENESQTMIIVVRLEEMGSLLGGITEASWSGNGRGVWGSATNATSYQVQLIDTKNKAHTAKTIGTTYDFSPYMQEAGSYSYSVRPVSETANGDWIDGGSCYIDEAQAATNKEAFSVEKEITYTSEEKRPDTMVVTYLNTGWMMDENGYWYHNEDGSYLQNEWRYEDRYWYYFKENGYAATDEYLTINGKDYYFDENSGLIIEQDAPDGRHADENGVLS